MQGLKQLQLMKSQRLTQNFDEIARVNEIVDGRMDARMHGKQDAYVTPCQQVRQ